MIFHIENLDFKFTANQVMRIKKKTLSLLTLILKNTDDLRYSKVRKLL